MGIWFAFIVQRNNKTDEITTKACGSELEFLAGESS